MHLENKRRVGAYYEGQAEQYLSEHYGYQILERNFRVSIGEVDLIARDGAYLVFIEVKYRAGAQFGTAAEAVNACKQRKLYRLAEYYIRKKHLPLDGRYRFDVVAFDGKQLRLYQNAYGGM